MSQMDICPKCKRPAMTLPYQKGILGKPETMERGEIIMCPECHLSKDGEMWINAYDELKKADDAYRRQQN